jgi:hypothetical protein
MRLKGSNDNLPAYVNYILSCLSSYLLLLRVMIQCKFTVIPNNCKYDPQQFPGYCNQRHDTFHTPADESLVVIMHNAILPNGLYGCIIQYLPYQAPASL